MSYVVTVTGQEPMPVAASNWLVALGRALDDLGVSADLDRLACERLPNGTVIARDLASGNSFVVRPADDFEGPDLPTEASTPFAVANLPQSVLLSNMNHVLRVPLNVVLGYSDLLRDIAGDDADATMIRDLDRIHAAGQQLTEIIESLVEVWRLEAGEYSPHLERFELASLLRDVADAVEPIVAKEHLFLLFDVKPDLGTVRFDPAALRTAVDRSIRRAISRAVGQVEVRAYLRDDHAVIHVRDDGKTPSLDELGEVFTIFARTDPEGIRDTAAHMQLTASRMVLRALGGDMSVAARTHKGSRISIEVPV